MIFDTKNNEAKLALLRHVHTLVNMEVLVEVKKRNRTRSISQNNALHLYFQFIADSLNELGLEFCYEGVKRMKLSTRYTPFIVKEFFWRPIQVALFDKKSTTELTTSEINEIIDVITKFFGERGVDVVFPSVESL